MSHEKIYVSSKLKHRDMWIDWIVRHDYNVISTWIHNATLTDKVALGDMWDTYRREAISCTTFILYLELGDIPKGCLIELGMALTSGARLIFVVPNLSLLRATEFLESRIGTVVYVNNCHCVSSLEEARRFIV